MAFRPDPSEVASLSSLLLAFGLGLLLGMRHALEPDHLAAVSTLVCQARSPRSGAMLGACWGLGHTSALVIVGGTLAALEIAMPPQLADRLEASVAVMLIALGVRAIIRALREGAIGPRAVHTHDRLTHAHGGSRAHVHVGTWTLATGPLLVGLIHGLAGSGALTALVLVGLPTIGARIAYIVCFGIGSVAGMALLSALAGWPIGRLRSSGRGMPVLRLVGGMTSLVLGLIWGYPFLARWVFSGAMG